MVELILRRQRAGVKAIRTGRTFPSFNIIRLKPGLPPIVLFFLCFTLFLGSCTREKLVFFTDPVWWDLYAREEKGHSPVDRAAEAARVRVKPIRGEFRDTSIYFSESIGDRVDCVIATPLSAETLIGSEHFAEGRFLRGILLNWYAPPPKGWKVVRFDYQEAYFEAGELLAAELIKSSGREGGISLGAALFLSPGPSDAGDSVMERRINAFKSGFESGKKTHRESEDPILQVEALGPKTERQQFLNALEEILKYEPDGLLISGFDFTRFALEELLKGEENKNVLIIVEEGLKIPNFIELIDYSIETDIYALLEEAFKTCAEGAEGTESRIVTVPAVLKRNRNP
jgi:hypothetical protein